MITQALSDELDMMLDSSGHEEYLTKKMLDAVEQSGRKFVFIIDNRDAVIREAENDEEARIIYLSLLRMWFKNGIFTPKVVAAAYMTGILSMDG